MRSALKIKLDLDYIGDIHVMNKCAKFEKKPLICFQVIILKPPRNRWTHNENGWYQIILHGCKGVQN